MAENTKPTTDALGTKFLTLARQIAKVPNLEGMKGGVDFDYREPNFIVGTFRIPVQRVENADGSETLMTVPFLQQ